ncbi:Rv2175c family DNA-binding protein [Microbacterium sp. HJ5]
MRRAAQECDSCWVTADDAPRIETEWLTLPELVGVLGEPLGRVRRFLDESHLIGSRRDGVLKVPAVFILDDHPIASLRGTAIVLHDAGFSDDEAIDWLLSYEDSIGMPPIEALRAGRKAEVRRVAQTLA